MVVCGRVVCFLSVQSVGGHLTVLLPEMTCTELADNYPHTLVTTASTSTSSVQSADAICCLSHCTVPRHPTASYLPAGTATGACLACAG